MKLIHGNHLMYCLNIHPAEHWNENLAAIQHFSLTVKAGICPDAPFALGLRLSRQAARELEPKLKNCALFLRQHNLYVVTINGFPYGCFHGTAIKERAYLPDWSSPKRIEYTLHLATILSNLLPEGETGTISTVPGHYGKEEKPSVISNLLFVADSLARMEKKTGRHIVLALEPEPDCFLDRLDSTVSFFKRLYALNESAASRYLGVCLDTCHAAVEFESPRSWLQKLNHEGIQVPKIQISAALRALHLKNPPPGLLPFADREYLHQTRIYPRTNSLRTNSPWSNSGNNPEEQPGKNLIRFKDLPEALAHAPSSDSTEWRIHFHVPLTWPGEGVHGEGITSTADLIEDTFFSQAYLAGGKHFEVETYSYGVLPGPKPPVTDSIIAELQWVSKKFRL
ncbi:MAG: metabolite traffic protein EboE [bacterium]